MTAALLERPVSQQSLVDGGATLESVLTAALREAQASGSAECPVCDSRMSFRVPSTRPGARGGEVPVAECGGCGSRLS